MRPFVIVMHMHGCPHCVAYQGERGIARRLAREGWTDVYMVEASQDTDVCEALGVQSFPTVLVGHPRVGTFTLTAAERSLGVLRDAVEHLRDRAARR